jgi:hypothetical protein
MHIYIYAHVTKNFTLDTDTCFAASGHMISDCVGREEGGRRRRRRREGGSGRK